MSNLKRVYVLGAGASKEANLPTGEGLKKNIANILSFEDRGRGFLEPSDKLFNSLINVHLSSKSNEEINNYYKAACLINSAMPQAESIDNFIDNHRDNKYIEKLGKLAIVKAILMAEGKSHLFISPSNINNKMNFGKLEKTWYSRLFKIIVANCTIDQLKSRLNQFVFIIFNYDRCFEQYLYHALQNYYDQMSENTAAELIKSIEIYHPYGSIGNLEWQNGTSIRFGENPTANNMLSSIEKIKTFTEGTDPKSSDIGKIQKQIMDVHVLVFLGFAYHPLNMKLIFRSGPGKSNRGVAPVKIFGTAKGISDFDTGMVEKEITDFYKKMSYVPEVHINNELHCRLLFDEFSRELFVV